MKRYQARKVISVLLTVLMLLSSVYLGLGVIASALTTADWPTNTTTLSNGAVYTVSGEKNVTASSSLTIDTNATVFIVIPEGAIMTVTGGNASNATAGQPAIKMNQNSKLIFVGEGALTVKGGNGANGSAGGSSNNANNSTSNGGAGGAGGAGGGAGIGTAGGAGGSANNDGGAREHPWDRQRRWRRRRRRRFRLWRLCCWYRRRRRRRRPQRNQWHQLQQLHWYILFNRYQWRWR